MEAKVEKKARDGKFKSWKMRCWRIRDRRLIHYNSSCNEWTDCMMSKIKVDIDVAHMASVSFYPKSNPKPNLLHIRHPKIGNKSNDKDMGGGLILKFSTNQKPNQDIMCSWLKVLTAWGVNRKKNRIYVAIPSNFSYALWNLLNALYDHPDLLSTEGIFRKEWSNVRVKHGLCNDLLYELICLSDLKSKYNNIYLLGKSLQYILCNLPSSIFGDDNFEDLLSEIKTYDMELIDNKAAKGLKDEELDSDVAGISYDNLLSLKEFVNSKYLAHDSGNKYKHRYGIISLVLQLIKQITMNIKQNRMSCHAMARLFSMCFESKQYIQNMLDPFRSLLLIKILIYHAYFLFPVKKWRMKDIVVAEKQEAITMEKYKELKLTKKQKKNRLKRMVRDPPSMNWNGELEIHNMDMRIPPPPDEWKDNDQVKKQQQKLRTLVRYESYDDLAIGRYERKESEISNLTFATKTKHHFEAIHTSKQRRRSISISLAKHKSLDLYQEDEQETSESDKSIKRIKRPMYDKMRSMTEPNIPAIKSPSIDMSSLTGFAVIKQNKICQFMEPCYLNNGIYGEYIYFICKKTCFRYDITYNEYKLYFNYPNHINILNNNNFAVSMDQNGKRIFIIGENCEFIEFINIDDEKEYLWSDKNVKVYCDGENNRKQQAHYNIYKYGEGAQTIFIEGEICELHIIGGELNNFHLRWDEHYDKMIKLDTFDIYFKNIKGHKILYINNEWNKEFKSKLILLGGCISDNINVYSNQILYCNIKENITKCEWVRMYNNIILPIQLGYFGGVVYKNIFIIIFGGITNNNIICNHIWYLNINSLKWIKSKIKCPIKSIKGWYAILTNDNMIHLFERHANRHYTIKVNHIITDNQLNVAQIQQENIYNTGDIQEKTTNLEIQRQKEIFYKTSSTSIATSIDAYTTDTFITTVSLHNIEEKDEIILYDEEKDIILEEKQEEIKQGKKQLSKQSLYDKYGVNVSQKSKSSSNNDYNERISMQQEIDGERFTCRSLSDWCFGLCGFGLSTEPTHETYDRVRSASYQ